MERSNNCFISARAKGALGHFASKYCIEEIEFRSYPIITQNIQTAYGDLPQMSFDISKLTLVSWYQLHVHLLSLSKPRLFVNKIVIDGGRVIEFVRRYITHLIGETDSTTQ